MKCPNCGEEMQYFGVTERGEDKYCCDDCYIHIEGGRITHGADKVKNHNIKKGK